ncbi:helix-turn-helix domain-containing protein [Streptomyces sp. NPDC005962]|uniref:AraC-like ligand-binding domain-containing protein n=1 Tax=Streptomyces sp. NPDC005962 TaxID=3154466 RepID=UPI0033CC4537
MFEMDVQIDDIPPSERFAAWRALCEGPMVPMELRSAHEDDFRATMWGMDLGQVTVAGSSFPSLWTQRTAAHIRRSDPELYHLQLNLRGEADMVHGGVTTTLGDRQFMLTCTSLPYEGAIERGRTDELTIGIPPSLLPFPVDDLNRLLGRQLSGRTGIGGLLADVLIRLSAEHTAYRPADTPRLGTVVADLLTALLAHELDGGEAETGPAAFQMAPESHRNALVLRIQDFVRRNLHISDLTPASIAAAHHISVRYLHRLFERQGHTVAAWIRAQRLERSCRDLADPLQSGTPIHAIAARWGFSHAADFSRAFRGTYGMPPREFRLTALAHGTLGTRETHKTHEAHEAHATHGLHVTHGGE